MTTRLRVVVDQLVAPVPGAIGRYTRDLTRALIDSAPANCEVAGIVSSSPPTQYEYIERELPGLADLYRTSLARRELAAAWQMGLTTSPGGGIIHSPSLFAPLRKHDHESGNQVVVTVHDTLAFSHPGSLSTAESSWRRAMLKRARKHADAIVVSTHALAARLADQHDFGDRIRVVSTAARSGLRVPGDAAERVAELGLPRDYLVTIGTLEPHRGVTDVLSALGRPGMPELPLIVLGPREWGELALGTVAEESGVRSDLVRSFDALSDADLAIVIGGAAAFIAPTHEEGDPATLIEALTLGTPVIHSDAPEYVETTAGAALSIPVGVAGEGYVNRLAAAISTVVTDDSVSDRLSIAGHDRSRAFSWRDSAERVWQLHADL
ncbi:glycosyltransferase involved in cell wall biosynthesis [Agromyces ramosus]|uniref:Glycosyltransferase involved in cell wall biosynthesis n=1 Tax=Agromyces ramosus TaxID=33879 RepID=A0A4Q7MJZ4_9MICO|nr:glycosyltransferase family 1 protein [Agromyces ramosus]RZS67933.1 glycosyltransferase involved in cell wall biosynthesis [Agromyces ramosus]